MIALPKYVAFALPKYVPFCGPKIRTLLRSQNTFTFAFRKYVSQVHSQNTFRFSLPKYVRLNCAPKIRSLLRFQNTFPSQNTFLHCMALRKYVPTLYGAPKIRSVFRSINRLAFALSQNTFLNCAPKIHSPLRTQIRSLLRSQVRSVLRSQIRLVLRFKTRSLLLSQSTFPVALPKRVPF